MTRIICLIALNLILSYFNIEHRMVNHRMLAAGTTIIEHQGDRINVGVILLGIYDVLIENISILDFVDGKSKDLSSPDSRLIGLITVIKYGNNRKHLANEIFKYIDFVTDWLDLWRELLFEFKMTKFKNLLNDLVEML